MKTLIFGLLVFLGMHSINMLFPCWRSRQIARLGELPWKGLFSVLAGIGLALIIRGFSLARHHPVQVYATATWLHHLNALITLVAFILVFSAYVPRNHFKTTLGHPYLMGVVLWSVGHLLSAGGLRDILLFGGFLLWSLSDFMVSRRRDRLAGTGYGAGSAAGTSITILVGLITWAIFAFWLHTRLIGVSPFR